MEPYDAVGLALSVADEGLAAGEMPIGAVVFDDEQILGRAHTQEKALGRRIVHADLLAMQQADEALGFTRPNGILTLAVNLEPCLMCMGAAITLGVRRVWFALPSPNDGAAALVESWLPPQELPYFAKPREIRGGIRSGEARAQFAAYAAGDGPAGMRAWAGGLASM
ncbi:tRNA-specific adenosine deaminase [Nocardia cerradoensis]|uniref:tRNA-specific adenosine deaminase n=1 Tax=Nocardia cerradoensis TaxID=85688 RepID=A0A231GYA9_9NOCA|nr:deaminase [Nocardia cerradoensis]OXR41613.1 tRNA-specific adenosine deaminase [Nocardia cerradoensis]